MLPPTQTVFPAAWSISAMRVVVVVFPSEPVTAITGQGQTWKNTSISEVTTAPWLRSASRAGFAGCIPGVRNTTSASRRSRYPGPRRSSSPCSSSSSTSRSRCSRSVRSQPVTRHPAASNSLARGRLLTPNPKINSRFCRHSVKSVSNFPFAIPILNSAQDAPFFYPSIAILPGVCKPLLNGNPGLPAGGEKVLTIPLKSATIGPRPGRTAAGGGRKAPREESPGSAGQG